MNRESPTLSIILSAALVVVLGLLGVRLIREFREPTAVAVSPRQNPPREARTRAPRDPRSLEDVKVDVQRDPGREPERPTGTAITDAETSNFPAASSDEALTRHVADGGTSPDARTAGGDRGERGSSLVYPDGVREVIATYLGQLASLSSWAEEQPTPRSWFVVGVLRDDAFRGAAARVLMRQRAGEFPLVVRGAHNPQALLSARIVFISDLAHAEDARSFFAGRAVMTATYTGGNPGDTWCDVEFIWTDGQVRVLIDRASLLARGIRISDELFKLESVSERSEEAPVAASASASEVATADY